MRPRVDAGRTATRQQVTAPAILPAIRGNTLDNSKFDPAHPDVPDANCVDTFSVNIYVSPPPVSTREEAPRFRIGIKGVVRRLGARHIGIELDMSRMVPERVVSADMPSEASLTLILSRAAIGHALRRTAVGQSIRDRNGMLIHVVIRLPAGDDQPQSTGRVEFHDYIIDGMSRAHLASQGAVSNSLSLPERELTMATPDMANPTTSHPRPPRDPNPIKIDEFALTTSFTGADQLPKKCQMITNVTVWAHENGPIDFVINAPTTNFTPDSDGSLIDELLVVAMFEKATIDAVREGIDRNDIIPPSCTSPAQTTVSVQDCVHRDGSGVGTTFSLCSASSWAYRTVEYCLNGSGTLNISVTARTNPACGPGCVPTTVHTGKGRSPK
jgi:hypothetical protein